MTSRAQYGCAETISLNASFQSEFHPFLPNFFPPHRKPVRWLVLLGYFFGNACYAAKKFSARGCLFVMAFLPTQAYVSFESLQKAEISHVPVSPVRNLVASLLCIFSFPCQLKSQITIDGRGEIHPCCQSRRQRSTSSSLSTQTKNVTVHRISKSRQTQLCRFELLLSAAASKLSTCCAFAQLCWVFISLDLVFLIKLDSLRLLKQVSSFHILSRSVKAAYHKLDKPKKNRSVCWYMSGSLYVTIRSNSAQA